MLVFFTLRKVPPEMATDGLPGTTPQPPCAYRPGFCCRVLRHGVEPLLRRALTQKGSFISEHSSFRRLRPMLRAMRPILRTLGSRRAKLAFNVVSVGVALTVGVLATLHFRHQGWPLAHADVLGLLLTCALFLVAYGLKAYGWQRLFAPEERPKPLALAAAGGAASVTGIALPGRFDDVVRIAVVRRFRGNRAGIGGVGLSLFLLGLVDAAALTPMSAVAAS